MTVKISVKLRTYLLFFISLTLLNIQNASGAKDPFLLIKNDNFRKSTAGFTNNASNFVGDSIDFKVTCPSKSFQIKAIRIGFYEGKEGKVIQKSKSISCKDQMDKTPSKWNVTASISTTNFPHGMYLFQIEDDQKFSSFVPIILREKNSTAKAIFSIPTMTMQAYNTWSGADTYGAAGDFDKRLRTVDFRKPYDKNFGTGKYLKYVHPLVVYIEKLNLDVAYVADTDLHFEKDLLANRTVLISAGHDEYWTLQERNNVLSARKSGTNTLFFGANAGYWNTRLIKSSLDKSITMEIYKSAKEDPNKFNPTVKFREINKPESELTGLEYKCFPAKGELEIRTPDSSIFRGIKNLDDLDLREIVGVEVDTFKDDHKFRGEITNLAESRVRCGDKWYFPRYGTMNMILGFGINGEGGLFSSGTMGWVVQGLSSKENSDIGMFTRSVTKNILESAIAGPLKKD